MSASTVHPTSAARRRPRLGVPGGSSASTAAHGGDDTGARAAELRTCVAKVAGTMAVMRAALPRDERPMDEGAAFVHQVSALALSDLLGEVHNRCAELAEVQSTYSRASQVLMYADGLSTCMERALWRACRGDGRAACTAGAVAAACELIETYLAEAVAELSQPAPGAKGGAA